MTWTQATGRSKQTVRKLRHLCTDICLWGALHGRQALERIQVPNALYQASSQDADSCAALWQLMMRMRVRWAVVLSL